MTLGNCKMSSEEVREWKAQRLAICDKFDSKNFVPKELSEATKIRLDRTENQGEIIVGEYNHGETAFIYSEKDKSLKTYSYDESGRMTKCEYIDNRAIAEEVRCDDVMAVPSFSPFHLSEKAKNVLGDMKTYLKKEKNNIMASRLKERANGR